MRVYDVTIRAKSSPRLLVREKRISVRAESPLAAAHADAVFAEVARVLADDLIAEIDVQPLAGGRRLMVGFVVDTRGHLNG